MLTIRKYVLNFCKEYHFPEEAKAVMLTVFDKLLVDSEAANRFFESIEKFNGDESQDYGSVFASLKQLAEQLKVHEFSINLLYLICIRNHTKELYRRAGLPEQVLHDSLEDFKIAMLECHLLYNVWGTHYGRCS